MDKQTRNPLHEQREADLLERYSRECSQGHVGDELTSFQQGLEYAVSALMPVVDMADGLERFAVDSPANDPTNLRWEALEKYRQSKREANIL